MRDAVRALLDSGNDVILDEMPIDGTILPAWRSMLAPYDTYWVQLTAPLAVLEARERARSHGRHLGNARCHYHLTQSVEVDLRIDSGQIAPLDAAVTIMNQRPF